MEESKTKNLKEILDEGTSFFRRGILWFNHRLGKIYSPNVAAVTGTVLVLIIALIILFLPPVTGVADDGSLTDIMLAAGLGYRGEDLESPVGAYFSRLYLHSTQQSKGFSSHRLLVLAAKWLETQFTHDNLFDIRFLAAIYLILYLPAVYMVLRGIVARVNVAAEATALVILGTLILGDAAMISYFNSLYPEAFWQVFLVYTLGSCMALQHNRESWTQIGLLGIMIAGSLLTLSERHCAVIGVVLMIFCIRQIFMEDGNKQSRMLAITGTVVLFIATLLSILTGSSRFTEMSHMHAITNGVMLQADNPKDVLNDFEIDERFETMADMSSFAGYPYALVGNPDIQRDFISHYSVATVILYYLKNPFDYIGLLEYGTRSSFQPNRPYVGNFEKDPDVPERAKNELLIFYSNFKSNSLPQTIGFLVILAIIYLILFRKQRGLQFHVIRWTQRERQIMLDTFFCMLVIGIADITAVICLSGTAELERYQMLYGICIDSVIMLFISEILHRTNILASEE